MKLEIIGSVSTGIFAVMGSWLVARGSSWELLILAALGALVAILELEEWQRKKVIMIVLFNTLVGAFGGPLLLGLAGIDVASMPLGGLVLLPFIVGWSAHSVITDLRAGVLDALSRWIARSSK
ncbi:MAG: hypothetical protein AB3N12_01430 [Ruegeria sp.]